MKLGNDALALLLCGTWGALGAVPAHSIPADSVAAPPQPSAACEQAAREQVFGDLAGYSRYGSANAALPPPGPRERRVVFMGDSITEAWATLDPEFFKRAGFVDRGISGQTTPQMLLRFRQDVIALKPAVVHILAGTNDVAGNTGPLDLPTTEANIASMVDLARANGIVVLLGSILPAADFPWRPGLNPGPKIATLNEWLKAYAADRHITYVDYHRALTDGGLGMRSDLTPDGVHPSQAGYRLMDSLALPAIRAAQQSKPPAR